MSLRQKQNLFFVVLTIMMVSCNSGYKKVDKKWSYVTYNEAVGKTIKYLDVDGKTFEILDKEEYAKDRSKVFLNGEQIAVADSKTFKIIGQGYSKDNFQVFMDNEIVIGANPETFKLLDFPYSRDDKNIYCGTIPMNIKSIESFKVISSTGMKITELTTNFIKFNPEYAFIDTLKYRTVIYGEGQAETSTEKFDGFKKKK